MSSALDTLLAAARYIELQEQQHLSVSPSPPSVRNLGRYHNQSFNNSTNANNSNNNNNNSNSTNNVRNNVRHHQQMSSASPSFSPVFGGLPNNVAIVPPNNSSNNSNHLSGGSTLNNHEYGSTILSPSSGGSETVRVHHTENRNEEPYSNCNSNNSLSSSFYVISTSPTPIKQLQSQPQQHQQQQKEQSLQKHQQNQQQVQQQQHHSNNHQIEINTKKFNITATIKNKNNSNDESFTCPGFDDDGDQIMSENNTNNKKSSTTNNENNSNNNNQSIEYRLPYNNNNNNSSSISTSTSITPLFLSSSPSSVSNYKFYSSSSPQKNILQHKKFTPLTPPPISNSRKIEVTRIRSLSFSSNKIIAANNNNNNNNNGCNSHNSNSSSITSTIGGVALSSTTINNNNGNGGSNNTSTVHNMMSTVAEDSSQSSINLSSSGYLSGSSVNSTGSYTSPSNLNLNNLPTGVNINNNHNNLINSADHQQHQQQNVPQQQQQQQQMQTQQQTVTVSPVTTTTTNTGRRRTTSTNSNGGTQRSPCILRAGTREVHNKLEKHRRAHLKECFEQLKVQLQLKDEEKKKPSNLAILGAAYRHVMSLRRRERELEQQVEQLAKDKINAQKKILSLKRELSVKYDNIDFSTIISDGDVGNIPVDRESLSDTASLSSGRGSIRYSSSSSLSSVNTVSSPVGTSIQYSVPATLSPVISSTSSSSIPPTTTSPCSPLLKSSSSPISSSNVIPLSLATKNHNASPSSSLQMESPVPSTPSPSPSSSSGISCSPVTSSSSPPMITNNAALASLTESIKLTNVPNGVKLNHLHAHHPHHPVNQQHSSGHQQPNVTIVATTAGATAIGSNFTTPIINISSNENPSCLTTTSPLLTTNNSGGIYHQPSLTYSFTSQNVQLSSIPKELSGKNGVCNRKVNNISVETSRELINPTSSGSSTILSGPTGLVSVNGGAVTANLTGCAKEIKVENFFDDSEQPTKVIKLFNGIALAPVDKDKLISSTPLALSQVVGSGSLVVSPFPVLTTPSPQGLRVIGAANGLATIELSSPAAGVQSHNNNNNRNQQQQSQQSIVTPPSATTVTSTSASAVAAAAQLHKLLVNAGTQSQVNHPTVSSSLTHTTVASVTPELARLPGGAELNILPAGTNGSSATLYRGNGKLAIVNNGITLKGADSNATAGRGAVHVVTPVQPNGTPISSLTPIVVSQGGQQGNNLAQLIASSPQLAGKVNLSVGVGGQTLPLISTQYLSSMKPMVVAVASNPSNLSSTSITGATITENMNSS